MSLQNATLSEGATVSPTGGVSKTYTVDGLSVNNGVHCIDASVADGRIRPSYTAKSIPGKVNPDGTWSNDKREVVLVRPKILADGRQKFPNLRITLTSDPENTQAEIDMLCNLGAQALVDADFTSLWRTGSLA